MTLKQYISGVGVALLVASSAAAQTNDDCSGALPITGFATFPFNNSSATGSGISDCNGNGVRKDVWYVWTAPTTTFTRFETCGTNTAFDTRIAVYDGADCNNLNFLVCAASNCLGLSQVSFNAVQGNQYLLRVGSRAVGQGGPGEFRLRIDPCPSSLDDVLEDNDDCATSRPLGDATYSNLWCSKDDPDWYQFCVPPGGSLFLDVLFTHSTGDIDIFAFDGCNNFSLGISASATDNENLQIDNTGATNLVVEFRVEMWPSDPNNDCNDYSMMVSGAGCSPGGSVGTNYCMANVNSTGSIASMVGSGSSVVMNNNLTVSATDLPMNSFGFFLTSQLQGFVANPGGSAGNLCVASPIGRYVGPGQIQQAGSMGIIALALDLTQIPQPTGFVSASAGETWNFQAWYRDAVGGMATSNFTDGLSVDMQ